MTLYGLKTCDTCRKAIKALPGVTFVDVRADGVPADVLARAHARARDPLALLAEHPALMKRPLIVADDGQMYLGWGKDVQAALVA